MNKFFLTKSNHFIKSYQQNQYEWFILPISDVRDDNMGADAKKATHTFSLELLMLSNVMILQKETKQTFLIILFAKTVLSLTHLWKKLDDWCNRLCFTRI